MLLFAGAVTKLPASEVDRCNCSGRPTALDKRPGVGTGIFRTPQRITAQFGRLDRQRGPPLHANWH